MLCTDGLLSCDLRLFEDAQILVLSKRIMLLITGKSTFLRTSVPITVQLHLFFFPLPDIDCCTTLSFWTIIIPSNARGWCIPSPISCRTPS